MDSIKVETLLRDKDFDLRLELLAGEAGLDRRVTSSRIQKPGLALSGFTEHIHRDRLQIFGNTEMSYLATLKPDEARGKKRRRRARLRAEGGGHSTRAFPRLAGGTVIV